MIEIAEGRREEIERRDGIRAYRVRASCSLLVTPAMRLGEEDLRLRSERDIYLYRANEAPYLMAARPHFGHGTWALNLTPRRVVVAAPPRPNRPLSQTAIETAVAPHHALQEEGGPRGTYVVSTRVLERRMGDPVGCSLVNMFCPVAPLHTPERGMSGRSAEQPLVVIYAALALAVLLLGRGRSRGLAG